MLSEQIAGEAALERMATRDKQKTYRLAVICLSVLLAICIICGTIIAVRTIDKMQETINIQFIQMHNLLSGAETITETYSYNADSDGSGTAVAGDNNTVISGDVDGESKRNDNTNNR